MLELYAPPPATGSSGAYARTKPYLEPADWRYGDDSLLGQLPGARARAAHAVRAADRLAPLARRARGPLLRAPSTSPRACSS